MTLRNSDVADLLDRLGDLYELDGAVVYRVLAYRRAAARIRETGESVDRLSAEGRLTELADVGETIATKVEEFRQSGSLAALERLEAKFPAGLVGVMRLPGVGAKTTRRLYDGLGITSVEDLRVACEAGRVRELPGLGTKAEEKMLAGIRAGGTSRKAPVRLDRALVRAEALLAEIRSHPACVAASEAGSLRRRRETVGDIDLIAASDDAPALLGAFAASSAHAEVIALGDTKCSAVSHDGIQVDLRVVPPASYGNLLQHFTGSKDHNIALREDAVARGFSVSEWGIETVEAGAVFRTASEDEVYRYLGYQPVPPELREDDGELALAREGNLPELVTLDRIMGDLHTHTVASDGHGTIADMAAGAVERGYAYLAITDHSAGVGMGIGLEAEATLEHAANVRRHAAVASGAGLELLAGSEVDIMADGSLYFDDATLAHLDWVVASIHVAQTQDRDRITKRLVSAAENPYVDVIGHPSGRLIGDREAYEFDLEAVIAACAEHGTFLEVNSNPRRLDLAPPAIRLAIQAGVGIVISTDAHRVETLDFMRYGVMAARRGWATPAAIVNTLGWTEFCSRRKASRRQSSES